MPLLENIRSAFGSDRERLAKRQAVKRELSELESVESKSKAIREQLRSLATREVSANATFDDTATKARTDLEAVETEVAALILADAEIPTKLAKRRDAALDALVTAESKRDAEVSAIKKLRGGFQKRLEVQGAEVSRMSAVRGKLQGYHLADPELLELRFINRQRSIWAERRLREAEREHRSCSERLATLEREREAATVTNSRGEKVRGRETNAMEIEAIREYQFWGAELDAARLEVEAASEEKKEIQRQIIEE